MNLLNEVRHNCETMTRRNCDYYCFSLFETKNRYDCCREGKVREKAVFFLSAFCKNCSIFSSEIRVLKMRKKSDWMFLKQKCGEKEKGKSLECKLT